jgi:hypothetical protein
VTGQPAPRYAQAAAIVLALGTDGELTRLHDAYRAEAANPAAPEQPGPAPADADAGPAALTHLTLHWSDGTATTAYPGSFPVL